MRATRLKRALEERRRTLDEYWWALRHRKAPHVTRDLLRRAQDAELELRAALAPFVRK